MLSYFSPQPPFKVHAEFTDLSTEGGVMCLVLEHWMSVVTLEALGRAGNQEPSWFCLLIVGFGQVSSS